ncbi:MAG: hypothetical protein Q9217_003117 [Psora testacea]
MLAAQHSLNSFHHSPIDVGISTVPVPSASQDKSLKNHNRSLPPNILIHPITSTTLPAYRRVITTLLPIRYPDRFYKESISNPSTSHTVALCAVYHKAQPRNGKRKRDTDEFEEGIDVVAGIQARLELIPPYPSTSPSAPCQPARHEYQLYIQTLATLSPYRCLSLAAHLLSNLVLTALTAHPDKRITSVYAHVWEANEDALSWYLNRGFSVEGDMVEGYYRRLRPGGARVLRKGIGVNEYLEARSTEQVKDIPLIKAIAGKEQKSHKNSNVGNQAEHEKERRRGDPNEADDAKAENMAIFRDATGAMGLRRMYETLK